MLPFFAPAFGAVEKLFDLIDDGWDTEGEKADREAKLEAIQATRDAALLAIQVAELKSEAEIAAAQAKAAAAMAAGKSWLQRNLFPLVALATVGLIAAAMAGVAEWPPLEVWAVLLVVAGGGVIDHRLFDWFRQRRRNTEP